MHPTSLIVWRLLIISFLALSTSSISWISGWSYDGNSLNGRALPAENLASIEPSSSMQINGVHYCMKLMGGQAALFPCEDSDSQPLWASPADWNVREGFLSDLNRDGKEEITLLVWRQFQPWPVDRFLPQGGRIDAFHDSSGLSCHLILLGWKDNAIREVWAGSPMADPIWDIHAADLNRDGVQELVALEYPYDGNKSQSSLVVWAWNGFGFSLGDRVTGSFASMDIVHHNQNVLILTQK